jgi:cobalt-zinc-cadmium efflux system outer membrane protein
LRLVLLALSVVASAEVLAMAPRAAAQEVASIAPPTAPLDRLEPFGERLVVGGGAPLTLERVLASVEAHHPAIDAARARLASASGARLAAEGGFDPVLAASAWIAPLGDYRYGRADVTVTQPTPFWGATFVGGWRIGRGVGGGDVPEYYRFHETLEGGELRAGLVVPLWRDGPVDARRAALARSEHGEDAAEHDLDARTLRTQLAAAEAYYRWVCAGVKASVAADLLAIAEERDRQVASRVAAGAVPAIEHLENRRAILERRQAVVAAERALERSAIALSLYVRDEAGLPQMVAASRVPADVVPMPLAAGNEAELVATALDARPELRRLRAQAEAARALVELAENQIAPRVDVGVVGSIDVGAADPEVTRPNRLSEPVLETWVSFQLPLGMREARGRRDAAWADVSALDAELELQADQIRMEVRDALSALRAAERALALATDGAEIAEAVARGERTRFENGAATLLVVNLREGAAALARAAVADAEADLRIARAWVALAAGRAAP